MRDRSTFAALRTDGQSVRRGPLSVLALLDERLDPPRVGYRLGRRFGPAVARNRLRRRVDAIVRDPATAVTLAPGAYLVGARPDAAQLSTSELRGAVERVFGAVSRAGSTAATSDVVR